MSADAPIVSRPYHAKMCCERCAFGRGEHAEWCHPSNATVSFEVEAKWPRAVFDWNKWLNVPMRVDPSMDASTIRIEDDHGNVLGSIVNIGKPKE